jgi:hypothetical protein
MKSKFGGDFMSERICKRCIHWEQPEYSGRKDDCTAIKHHKTYEDEYACDLFEDRYTDEEE